jgi:hypothetical protein
MKLLDEIIDLLADENASLNAALLKTKVLMHTIGHAELAEWVNDELNGYPKDKPVPDYRIVGGRVAGNIQNAVMIQANVNLPTYHLPKKLKTWLENHELREAMSVLQDMASGKPGHSLHMPLSPEIGAQGYRWVLGSEVLGGNATIADQEWHQSGSVSASRLCTESEGQDRRCRRERGKGCGCSD